MTNKKPPSISIPNVHWLSGVPTGIRTRELIDAQSEAYVSQVRVSLQDVKAGRVKRGTAKDLIKELGLED